MSGPVRLQPDPDGIPEELRDVDHWICWRVKARDGEPTKVPVDPLTGHMAKANDPDTWRDFPTAWDFYDDEDTDAAGIGFVFSNPPEEGSEEYEQLNPDQQDLADKRREYADPFAGVDLDDCRDPETKEFDGWARDVLTQLDTYAELSPSGTGAHAILEGEVPDGGNRSGDVEMYDDARYFTVTGHRLEVNL